MDKLDPHIRICFSAAGTYQKRAKETARFWNVVVKYRRPASWIHTTWKI